MTPQCFFLFGIHLHQPVGSFTSIIEEVCQRAYLPFFEVLERHPAIRICLHISGSLLDNLIVRHPEFLDQLKRLADRDQLELLTGAYEAPILPALPEHDRLGQIQKMTETIERRFGQNPRGIWLAE